MENQVDDKSVTRDAALANVRQALCKDGLRTCKVCGYAVRGPGHEEGKHHKEKKNRGK